MAIFKGLFSSIRQRRFNALMPLNIFNLKKPVQFIYRVGDVERKLKEAEAREEALLRRITEKEKALNKMRFVK